MEELSIQTLEAICNALPVDLTFIDENDAIRYYNQNEHKVFKRSPELLGTKVQDCHSEATRQQVKQIISELKAGRKSITRVSEHKGRRILDGYFRVSDGAGRYIGALEVAQDITELQKMTL